MDDVAMGSGGERGDPGRRQQSLGEKMSCLGRLLGQAQEIA